MGIARATVSIPARSGLPEDVQVQTFHFGIAGNSPTQSEAEAIRDDLSDFYLLGNASVTGSPTLVSWMSSGLLPQPTTAITRVYGIVPGVTEEGAPTWVAGSPDFTYDLVLGNGGAAAPLPEEVAACITWHGDLTGVAERVPGGPAGPAGDTRPRASRRGRLFIGKLGADCVAFANGRTTLAANFRLTLVSTASRLANSSDTQLVVASTKLGTGFVVTGGWVDDTFDTQRRRGPARSLRTLFTVA